MIQTAFAEPTGLVEYRESSGSVNIYISGLSGASDYAVMLLREPDVYTEDNLAFLDQVQTASDGTLNLSFVQQTLDATQLELGENIGGKTSPYAVVAFQLIDGRTIPDTGRYHLPAGAEHYREPRFLQLHGAPDG